MMVPCRVCSGTTTPARDSAQSCTAATIIRLRDGGIPVVFFALRDELGQPRLEPDRVWTVEHATYQLSCDRSL
jgi:hypothetical protein